MVIFHSYVKLREGTNGISLVGFEHGVPILMMGGSMVMADSLGVDTVGQIVW